MLYTVHFVPRIPLAKIIYSKALFAPASDNLPAPIFPQMGQFQLSMPSSRKVIKDLCHSNKMLRQDMQKFIFALLLFSLEDMNTGLKVT